MKHAKPPSYGLLFTIVSSSAFMVNLDLWVANVAFEAIGTDFDVASLARLSWVLNAYTITLAASLVLFGRMGDRFGQRRLFLVGTVLFSVASAVCAAAPDVNVLIIARVFQGLGAASLLPTSLAILMQVSAPERRQSAVRLWSAVGGMAAALGPVLGGLLVQIDWRWIFLANVPIGCLILALGMGSLPRASADTQGRPIDVLGSILLTGAIGATCLGLVQAPEWSWADWRTITTFSAAGIFVAVFASSASRRPEPLIDPRLLQIKNFRNANIANIAFSVGFSILLISLALWCQAVWKYSALRTGLALSPGPAVVPIAVVLSIPLSRRFGSHRVSAAGCLLFCGSVLWLAHSIDTNPNYAESLLVSLLFAGFGFAFAAATLIAVAAESLPSGSTTTGSAMINAGRQLAGCLGVSILVTIAGSQHAISDLSTPLKNSWYAGAVFSVIAIPFCLMLIKQPVGEK
ncbi:MFS transporter [Streptomyces bobili]|uniref:MFS transporter n=1 Tax=Streptomyces bobili TaxID=67280 RepID=UPI0037FFACA1